MLLTLDPEPLSPLEPPGRAARRSGNSGPAVADPTSGLPSAFRTSVALRGEGATSPGIAEEVLGLPADLTGRRAKGGCEWEF